MGVHSNTEAKSQNLRKLFWVNMAAIRETPDDKNSPVKYYNFKTLTYKNNEQVVEYARHIDGFLVNAFIDDTKYGKKLKLVVRDGDVEAQIQLDLTNFKGNKVANLAFNTLSKLASANKLGRLLFETAYTYNFYVEVPKGKDVIRDYGQVKGRKSYDVLKEKYGEDRIVKSKQQDIRIYNVEDIESMRPFKQSKEKILNAKDENGHNPYLLFYSGLNSSYLHPSILKDAKGKDVDYSDEHFESFTIGYDYHEDKNFVPTKGINPNVDGMVEKCVNGTFKKGVLAIVKDLIEKSQNDYDTSNYSAVVPESVKEGGDSKYDELPEDMKNPQPNSQAETEEEVAVDESVDSQVEDESVGDDEDVDDLPF